MVALSFLKNNIPFRFLKSEPVEFNSKALFVEVNLRQIKWLLILVNLRLKSSNIISVKHWILILKTTRTSFSMKIPVLKFVKAHTCMNSIVFVICIIYAIKLLAIKIQRIHHALIFFLIPQDRSSASKQWPRLV